jgi:hypothetical protein
MASTPKPAVVFVGVGRTRTGLLAHAVADGRWWEDSGVYSAEDVKARAVPELCAAVPTLPKELAPVIGAYCWPSAEQVIWAAVSRAPVDSALQRIDGVSSPLECFVRFTGLTDRGLDSFGSFTGWSAVPVSVPTAAQAEPRAVSIIVVNTEADRGPDRVFADGDACIDAEFTALTALFGVEAKMQALGAKLTTAPVGGLQPQLQSELTAALRAPATLRCTGGPPPILDDVLLTMPPTSSLCG